MKVIIIVCEENRSLKERDSHFIQSFQYFNQSMWRNVTVWQLDELFICGGNFPGRSESGKGNWDKQIFIFNAGVKKSKTVNG